MNDTVMGSCGCRCLICNHKDICSLIETHLIQGQISMTKDEHSILEYLVENKGMTKTETINIIFK